MKEQIEQQISENNKQKQFNNTEEDEIHEQKLDVYNEFLNEKKDVLEVDLDKSLEDADFIQLKIGTPEIKDQYYYGRYCTFFKRKQIPLIAIGPHWPFTVALLSVILYFNHFFIKTLNKKGETQYAQYMLWLCIMHILSFLYVFLKNPGIITRSSHDNFQSIQINRSQRLCSVCQVVQEREDQHCDMCKVCIKGLDHHCIWTGKCIGQGNLTSFYIMLVFTVIEMILLILLSVIAM